MLKKLLTATRFCLKKITAAVVTFAVRAINGVVNLGKRIHADLTEGWCWLGTKLRKPSVLLTKNTEGKSSTIWTGVAATLKAVCIKRFLLFLGGLICCFILPDEAKGDLTWFERMLTSSRDFFINVANATTQKTTDWFVGLFSRRAGELT